MPDTGQLRPTGVLWYRRAGVWIGIGINPGSLSLGGGLAAKIPLSTLVLIIPLGVLILTTLAVTQGVVSRRRREPLAKRASSTFGPGWGAGLLNVLMAFSLIGWGSFYVGLAGFSLANLLDLPNWLGALMVAGTVLILNEVGLNRWNSLVWLTALTALGAAVVALIALGAKPTLATMPAYNFALGDLLWIIGSIVAYAIVFALRCSDFTWDLNADTDVVKASLWLFIPLIISLGIGAVLYQAAGDWNLADVLAQTRLASLGHLFLITSIASPALSGLHSGTLALRSVISLNERQIAILFGLVIFILGATRFDHQLLPFLDVLGAVLPPALVVSLAALVYTEKPPKSLALAAWMVGAVTAIIFKLQGGLIHIALGAIVSLIFLYIATKISSMR